MKATVKDMKLTEIQLKVISFIDIMLDPVFQRNIMFLSKDFISPRDKFEGICPAVTYVLTHKENVDDIDPVRNFILQVLDKRIEHPFDPDYRFPPYYWAKRLKFLKNLKRDILSGEYNTIEL